MDAKDDEKIPPTPDTLVDSLSSKPEKWGPMKEVGDEHNDAAQVQRPISSHSTLEDEADGDDTNEELQRYQTPKRDPVHVPVSERRGLFARFAIVAEITDPRDYPNRTNWFVTFVVAFAAAAAPVGSGIIFRTYSPLALFCKMLTSIIASLHQVATDLHASETLTNLNVALFMLSMAIFPLWWSAFSETLGRRTIYLTSFALFVLWSVLAAVSKSIGMLIVFRMLSGGAAASVQAVGAGTIADLWESRERGRAMGYFYLGPLCGPLFAPIVGGALAQRWNWRASLYGLAIYGCKLNYHHVISLVLTELRQSSRGSSYSSPYQRLSKIGRISRR